MMNELGTDHQKQTDTKIDSSNDGRGRIPELESEQPPLRPGQEKINPPNGRSSEPNTELVYLEKKQGMRPGDSYVRVQAPFSRYFKRVGPGHFVATPEVTRPAGG